MQLSLHADYACRVLIYLATSTESKASIEEVAAAFKISQNHLVKVVHRLGQLGFIETTRGRNGGICLAEPADKILIGDVIRQMEPHFNIVECFDQASNTCSIQGACGLQPALMRARNAFLQALDKVSLAQVTSKTAALSRSLQSHKDPGKAKSNGI